MAEEKFLKEAHSRAMSILDGAIEQFSREGFDMAHPKMRKKAQQVRDLIDKHLNPCTCATTEGEGGV